MLPTFIRLSGALVLMLTAIAPARPEAPLLKWGMDETGGAPYIYDSRTKGFEIELAAYLAKELGRTSEPITGDWKALPESLDRGDFDIVLNGYEYAVNFREQASVPYYIYRLALSVNKDDNEIHSWDDLRKRKPDGSKRKVIALTGSAAERYMKKVFKDDIDFDTSDDVSNTFDLLANKQIDATVQDNPAAIYYVKKDEARLKQVGEGLMPNFYVILTRVKDKELRAKIDEALRKAIRDGTLEKIYRKYNLWNDDQERLWYWAEQPWPPGADVAIPEAAQERPVDWSEVTRLLGAAALKTLQLAVFSFPFAVLLGMLIGVARMYGPGWVRIPCIIYVEVIRGTPLLLQLFVIYYLLPRISPVFKLDPLYAGIIGLAINYAAYEAEIFRAGLQAIPRGQMEAALALGMTPMTAVRRVIVPQAFRIVIPPITNDFIALFKDTSICSAILITELTRQYNVLYNNHREFIIVFAIMTAALYLMMSYPLSLLARLIERRLRRERSDA